ncbi:hypothetical protein SAMN05446935_6149 [Burkholderia sp. YR290]|nr:hypothetical protein SAMN05446935_6149 [Burkholderia sp. YR290]
MSTASAGPLSQGIDPSDVERKAIKDAVMVLNFAAANAAKVEASTVRELTEVEAAARSKNWSPDYSQKLWHSFNELCLAIKPASVDSILATQPVIEVRSFPNIFRKRIISDSGHTARFYVSILLFLITITCPIQFYAWLQTNLIHEGDDVSSSITKELQDINPVFEDISKEKLRTEDFPKAERVTESSLRIMAESERLTQLSTTLSHTTPFYVDIKRLKTSPDAEWYSLHNTASQNANLSIQSFLQAKSAASILIGILVSFILPIFFGTLGATAFVTRHILQQISEKSYTPTSQARHIVRLALGAMMGFVVGIFGDLSTKLSLSPLAFSFLAGYGVEPIFTLFDNLIDKFRPTESTSNTKTNTRPI